jgi:hypothetical protein
LADIVFIADADDTGVCRVVADLHERQQDVAWIALAERDEGYRFELFPSSFSFKTGAATLDVATLADTTVVFYRRWRQRQIPFISSSHSDDSFRQFAEREWDAACTALFLRIEIQFPHLQWTERPSAATFVKSRITLLEHANLVGIHTPAWVASTRSDAPVNLGAPLVAKPINLVEQVSENLSFGTADISPSAAESVMGSSCRTPAYFQRRIHRAKELRIYFVFGTVVCLELATASDATDIRNIPPSEITIRSSECPVGIKEKIERYCTEIRLGFSVFDFVVDSDEMYWLVDITTNGSWDHLESPEKPWLSEAISEAIVNRDKESTH